MSLSNAYKHRLLERVTPKNFYWTRVFHRAVTIMEEQGASPEEATKMATNEIMQEDLELLNPPAPSVPEVVHGI